MFFLWLNDLQLLFNLAIDQLAIFSQAINVLISNHIVYNNHNKQLFSKVFSKLNQLFSEFEKRLLTLHFFSFDTLLLCDLTHLDVPLLALEILKYTETLCILFKKKTFYPGCTIYKIVFMKVNIFLQITVFNSYLIFKQRNKKKKTLTLILILVQSSA